MRVLLRAEVTQPSVELSHDSVDFGEVECGQCKIVSVQLHNHTHVTANWAFVPPTQNSEKQGGNNEKVIFSLVFGSVLYNYRSMKVFVKTNL